MIFHTTFLYQFASTAKKMKNDPHVTEVSDDGALLKRYRNEIVDLKRRLQEVSVVTLLIFFHHLFFFFFGPSLNH